MNILAKLLTFLPFVFQAVAQVETDLQGKPGSEKKTAALDALKGAGAIAQVADGKDADSIAAATDVAGKAIDTAVSIMNHTGTFAKSPAPAAPEPLSDADKKQLAELQARAGISK